MLATASSPVPISPLLSEVLQVSSVPREVVAKFNVESVSDTSIEELLKTKIATEIDLENEAFYIVNLGTVVKKYQEWIGNLPRVKPFYAVKCNPNTAIIKTLASLGANFDCASKAEMQQVLGCGVSPSRIIYANPTKMVPHINYANSNGIQMMTFDNAHELRKIAQCYPEAKLLLRIITDDSQSVCRFSSKFGAPPNQWKPLLQLIKELNLNLIGVSFHVGSGCMSARSFNLAIRNAHEIFEMAESLGMPKLTTLDLGGGWPGSDEGAAITFSEIAAAIRPVLDELFSETEIIAEPGRYFVAESHTLAVNVFAKRVVDVDENEKEFLYYVNDGVYQSFNCIFFDHIHPKPLVLNPMDRVNTYKCTIFGPTCDSLDCIAKDIYLPELEVGEWIYFKEMGAYTVAAASPFNGFKSSPTTFYIY